MKKILVIGSKNSGTKNDPRVIAEQLRDDTVEAQLAYWEDLVVSVASGAVGMSINGEEVSKQGFDLVVAVGWYKSGRQSLYRDVAFAFALYLEHHGISFWNREMLYQRSTSKLSCMVQLALEGVPVPDTLFSLSNASLDSQPLPFVAKAASASRGRSNYLVDSDEARADIDRSEAYFLVQPFLENDHDLRVICMGGTPRLILKRSRGKDVKTHLNNVSQGGSGEWLELSDMPSELLTISEKTCTILGRDLAGIDFIPDKSSPFGYSCLEVNAIPQLTSGHDVEIKMATLKQTISEI